MSNQGAQGRARVAAREAGGAFVDGYTVRILRELTAAWDHTPYDDEEERARLGSLLVAHAAAIVQRYDDAGTIVRDAEPPQ